MRMNTVLILLALIAVGATVVGTGSSVPTTLVGQLQRAARLGFGARSSKKQASVAALLNAWEQYGDGDFRKLLYILATAWHESGLEPIPEKKAAPGTPVWDLYQYKYWPSGYYGRGFVQLTWKDNYQKMGDLLGIDLVNNPDLALDLDTAAKIAVYGMMNGSFTGKSLGKYFNATKSDPYNARYVIAGSKMVNNKDTAKIVENHYNTLKSYFPNVGKA